MVEEKVAVGAFAQDNQDGIVAGDGAQHGVGVVAVDVGRQTAGVARAGVHYGQIAREIDAFKARVAQEVGYGRGRRLALGLVGLGQQVAIAVGDRHLDGAQFAEVARERGLRHVVTVAQQFAENLLLIASLPAL